MLFVWRAKALSGLAFSFPTSTPRQPRQRFYLDSGWNASLLVDLPNYGLVEMASSVSPASLFFLRLLSVTLSSLVL